MTRGPADRPSLIRAIWQQRCPRCRVGPIFRSGWVMNDACPACGLRLMRETGYFTGAMYFSYALGIPLVALLTLATWLILPKWPLYRLVLLAWVLFLPLVPAVFRYSRVLWIYFDRSIDPE